MSFVVIEFGNNEGLAVVRNDWITPKKTEVFWPPVKDQKKLDKYLLTSENLDKESWQLYPILRTLYRTDDLIKAKKQSEIAEVTSDLQTEDDDTTLRKKRNIVAPSRFTSSSDEEELIETPRPPSLKKKFLNSLDKGLHKHIVTENVINHSNVKCASSEPSDSVVSSEASSAISSVISSTENIINLLSEIKIQNNQILAHLKEKDRHVASLKDFPFLFPIKETDDVDRVESILKDKDHLESLIVFLSTIGGSETTTKVNKILKYIINDSVAAAFNFYGQRSGKKAFADLTLRVVIIESIKQTSPGITTEDIENCIKQWLKHAPEREKKTFKQDISTMNFM